MPEDTPRPAQAAIRTDLGAIFVSMELSRRAWLITSLEATTPAAAPISALPLVASVAIEFSCGGASISRKSCQTR